MTIQRSTAYHGNRGHSVHILSDPDDEAYDDAQDVRRFHSLVQKVRILLRHGRSYLQLRNVCTSLEPYDVETRMAKLRRRVYDVVCDFRSFNAHDSTVQSAPLIGCSDEPKACGVVVGIRPCRSLPTRQIFDSDVILEKFVLGSVIVYTGEQIVAALLRPAHPSAHYGEWYSIPSDAIDPFVELRPEDHA
jgi:hypothetical protein